MKENVNRAEVKKVVLLVTDGKSYDDVEVPAKHLRDDGVEVGFLLKLS